MSKHSRHNYPQSAENANLIDDVAIPKCMECVPEDEIWSVETFGEFRKIAVPGFLCVGIPPFCSVNARLKTRIQQSFINCEVKTLDNVFVYLEIAVQYCIKKESAYEAIYILSEPRLQMKTYIIDTIRSTIPTMNLDEIFEKKNEISLIVKKDINNQMAVFGYTIIDTLIIDIVPNSKVKTSMNAIMANRKLKEATYESAEALKIQTIKQFEAVCECQYLQGVGLARQRLAIIEHLSDSVSQFEEATKSITKHESSRKVTKEITDIVMISQYFDTLKTLSKKKNLKCVFFNEESNSRVSHNISQMRDSLLQSK